MTDPSLYWASTQANPDKPKVVILHIATLEYWNAVLRKRLRDEAHCAAMREARGRKPEPVDLSPGAFTNSARKDDPLARRGSGESPS